MKIWIIWYGQFGQFLHKLIQKHQAAREVKVSTLWQQSDNTLFFSQEEVCQSDVVFLTVPIAAFVSVFETCLPHFAPETIVVDICTVKLHPSKLLQQHKADVRYLSTHPMFGPYSYKKKGESLKDLRIVLTEHNLPENVFEKIELELKKLGLKVLHMTPDEHDKKLAETLFIAHLVCQTLRKGEFCRTDIDTVSFGFLMDAVESVTNDMNLFQDVYTYNPYCKDALKVYRDAADDITDQLQQLA